MSLTLVRLACFRLGIDSLNILVRGLIARTALPRTNRHTAAGNCPGISGIAVRELLKALSGDYRKSCPDFSETRT
ncbi:hypothetical protein GCM10007874_50340 [Labrys miyagiensis]|uniref:Uncharacterized protein n=1 Tax=Labrys miyagiensis TaxID=346912 RepID=A0ABQ6CUT7_9HYPH|nr:hypothetical protein GCM10007874_50340 [Labrys miyagiensis]